MVCVCVCVCVWQSGRLPPEVNRILYVRNLPFNITGEELYEVFGKYGAIRQIRMYVRAAAEHTHCVCRRVYVCDM